MARKPAAALRPRRGDGARPLLYSKTCQDALRAIERIAAAQAEGLNTWVPQARIAREIGLPAPSLAQTLHRLRRAGLLNARRGPSGGVGLARPPHDITVLEVVHAIDGAGVAGRCVLGFDVCSSETPCPAHPVWGVVRPLLERELEQKSLLDLVHAVARKRHRKRGRPA
jgi:Rrf2 family protein